MTDRTGQETLTQAASTIEYTTLENLELVPLFDVNTLQKPTRPESHIPDMELLTFDLPLYIEEAPIILETQIPITNTSWYVNGRKVSYEAYIRDSKRRIDEARRSSGSGDGGDGGDGGSKTVSGGQEDDDPNTWKYPITAITAGNFLLIRKADRASLTQEQLDELEKNHLVEFCNEGRYQAFKRKGYGELSASSSEDEEQDR